MRSRLVFHEIKHRVDHPSRREHLAVVHHALTRLHGVHIRTLDATSDDPGPAEGWAGAAN